MQVWIRLGRRLRSLIEPAGPPAAFLAVGLVLQAAIALVVTGGVWAARLAEPRVPVWVLTSSLPPLVLVALLLSAAPLSRIQLARLRALLGVQIPGQPLGPPWAPARWRSAGYHLLVAPLIAAAGVGLLALWLAAAAASTILIWIWALSPAARALSTTQDAYLTLAGVGALAAAAWLTGALARLDTWSAWALLGPSRTQQLTRRVADLALSRAAAVEAADAERRRIERDLHDGAQQRLVCLAVNLGLARATLTGLPDHARQVLDQTHHDLQEAITELGDLVRGLHPAVLEDRGLDAALSGVVARCPIPARLQVDLPFRASPPVEAAAYFVIREALANVVKHARASSVQVRVTGHDPSAAQGPPPAQGPTNGRAPGTGRTLRLQITDDGIGGAQASAGTGLAGLASRVASMDGTLRISSPPGGPTELTAELPCTP